MTRIEELTNAVLDDSATPEEIAELERLVAPADGRAEHLDLLRIEGDLRARGPAIDVTRESMDEIRADVKLEVSTNVMQRVRRISARRGGRTTRPRRAVAIYVAVAAGILVWAIGAVLRSRDQGGPVRAPRLASDAPAEMIRPGESITTGPGESRRFVYRDGTTVIVGADTRVTFQADDARKALELTHGSLDADIAPQSARSPMRIATPTSESTIVGTRLLLAEGRGGTLLNVDEGSVLFVNSASRRALTVGAGHYCIGTSTGTTMTTVRTDGSDRSALARLVLAPRDHEEHGDHAAPAEPRIPPGVGDNLLRNATFAAWDRDGPADWKVLEQKQNASHEPDPGHPTAATALRVDVVRDGGSHYGQILQSVRIRPGTKYVLAGDIKSSRERSCFFQVKLRYRRKELSRIDTERSTTEWRRVSVEFDTGSADNVLILCRYRQKPEHVGGTNWWTDVSLRRAADDE